VVSAPARPIPSSSLPLQIEAVVKRFGQVTAVDGITLELRSGECLGLLGPNGAGKSTLIRSIVGRVVPDAGRVAIFGSPANSAAARAALGWVPQELALYPRLTSEENLESFGRYHGLAGAGLQQAVAWCLGWASLQDRAGELAKKIANRAKCSTWNIAKFYVIDSTLVSGEGYAAKGYRDTYESRLARGSANLVAGWRGFSKVEVWGA